MKKINFYYFIIFLSSFVVAEFAKADITTIMNPIDGSYPSYSILFLATVIVIFISISILLAAEMKIRRQEKEKQKSVKKKG